MSCPCADSRQSWRAAGRDVALGVRLGNPGNSKAVGEGVYELRMDSGPGYRVYFGQAADSIVILLCAGTKGTQTRDIARAKRYWADYRST